MEFQMLETETNGTIIKVVGVGGAGGNAVQHMINKGVQGVDFVVMNTDAQALSRSRASNVIQLGNTGLGAGAKPEMGRAAAEEARERISDALRGAHMVFITAGMGGGTGTGAAPVVAQIAKEMGILTVGVVSKPFEFEGGKRMRVAEAGSQQLEDHVDSLIVVLNDKLFEVMGDDAEMDKCFQCADDVLNNAVAGIAEIINVDGLVNVDFEDVKTVMGEQGKAMMGTATVAGVDRARLAAEQAVASPLLEGVDLSGARGVLVNITSSRSLRLSETREVMNTIKSYAAEDATVIFGAVYDDAMGDALRVTVVATGLGRTAGAAKKQQSAPMTLLRTGTDNQPVSTAQAYATPQSAADYGAFDKPAVWRNSRETAASHVQALQEKGVDTYDIPAFLRKQAD
ncbi:cell division protein FtsZ [Trinickia caryophylli]|uniref:Cell division protein FtsZ n=1 Tax=Trinickia caryophylli TaxID=28094 RepID=A0A1X7C8Z1_TRICW|nr:cell division protein FtsZ [Trinickia caryophylli]PMS09312.1 cell division protein FtsZ [Trinickia caryophylli]TRX19570.1 cell division protein FtsZ [Trinickia caryophylli]WQE13118.1 cell division protein FtsZ [Trinickia caryophylli]SME92086.1 cell division protein FtsZ [Trinickia caryophylli]GLU30858.1 cell division protein FtsZ [Trinickia caryophylli]